MGYKEPPSYIRTDEEIAELENQERIRREKKRYKLRPETEKKILDAYTKYTSVIKLCKKFQIDSKTLNIVLAKYSYKKRHLQGSVKQNFGGIFPSINYYRTICNITPEIEQEIVDSYNGGETIDEIQFKYKLTRDIVGRFLLVNNCKVDFEKIKDYKDSESWERLHPCEMFDYIPYKHNLHIDSYNMGNDINWITLCSRCATTLGFKLNKVPKWYPKVITNKTDFRKELLKYVKNNYNNYNGYNFYDKQGRSGLYFSKKNQKMVKWYSTLELQHIKIMEEDKDIVKYSRGPKIPYYDYMNDKESVYHVDFQAWYKDETIKLVESKVFEVLVFGVTYYPVKGNSNFICKIEVAEKYCKRKGYFYEFWTEKDLK